MSRRLLLAAQGAAVGLVVLLLALLLWKLVADDGGSIASATKRGERPPAPEFVLERLDGDGDLSLSSLRGKAVVLNFWASWCVPCKDEAPFLEEVWQENRDDGLVVIGLDAKDFRRDARAFAERFELTFPLVYDGPGSTLSRWGVTGFPETFVIDRRGRVVDSFLGAVDSDEEIAELRAATEAALES